MAYSKITLNGQTLMDVTSDTVEANKLLTGETATAANGQKVTGTLVTSNDFIITLTQNQSGDWEPDCTFAEAVAAYNAEKKVAFVRTDGVPCSGEYNELDNVIYYGYLESYYGNDGSGQLGQGYYWNSSGITKESVSNKTYSTGDADAVPANVLSGKKFYNANGYQVGTAAARSSSNLTVSGSTVTAPAGFYSAAATKTVASGTAGIPTATKGTVSNHSVSVTPSVTNTTGYITGGTKTGTAVTVAASELVSGTKSITENGNAIDVTNYANVNVNVESVNNQNKTVTPTKSQQSITADTGYTGLGTVTMDPIPANYVQIKDTYLSNDLTITPSESTQYIDVLDQTISSSPEFPTLTISNRVGTCNVSLSGLENNVPYLMYFTVTGQHNNQYFHNYKNIIIMFTNEVTSINLSNFETDGYTNYVNSAVITKSGDITVNFNIDIVGSVYANLFYQKNNNNIIGYKYAYVYAIPSTYVGSGVTTRTSSNLTASGATVTAPAGYYANAATKSVASGTAGTPTVTKGTVSNHSISVTPSVTNTTGYITGGTKTGTAVTVAASELVSGTLSVTSNSIYDVTNYASVDVNCPVGLEDKDIYTRYGLRSRTFTDMSIDSIRVGAFAETYISSADFANVTYIADYAFYSCTQLQTVSFPRAQTVGGYAFQNCLHLSTVEMPSVSTIYSMGFAYCKELVSASFANLKQTFQSAFMYCSSLKSFYAPSLSFIAVETFASCYQLTNFDFTNTVSIYSRAFIRCYTLSNVIAPSLRSLGDSVFYSCSGITEVSMPVLTSLGSSCFQDCISLSNVNMPILNKLPAYAFYNAVNLKSANFESVTQIGSSCFYNCSKLDTLTLSPYIASVYNSAFYNAGILSFVTKSLAYLGTAAFYGCTNLSTVILSKSTGTITFTTDNFKNCHNLISLYILTSSRCALTNSPSTYFLSTPIYDYSDVAGRWGSIFVPASLYDSYRSATNWVTLADRFVSLTSAEIEALLA